MSQASNVRLPVMYGFRESVEAGGLIAFGPNIVDLNRRAAAYVDKILKGAKPAVLPVEQPTKFELSDQPQDREDTRADDPAVVFAPSGRGDRIARVPVLVQAGALVRIVAFG